ncbi:hypothetical protein Esti_004449 [Eimeria stiedai]
MEHCKVPGSAFALFCYRRRAEVKTLLERTTTQKASCEPQGHTKGVVSAPASSQHPQLGDVQKELSTQWKDLNPEEKQAGRRWLEEFEALKQQHRQQRQEDQQAQQAAAATTSSVATEFPQARIIRIAKLTPSVKKISAEGVRYLNLATAAALRQFTMRSLSGRERDKTLTVDDVLAMINRGGTPLRFLQECKYVVTEDEEVEEFEKNADCCPPMQADEIDIEAPDPSNSFPRPLPLAAKSGLPNYRRLGAKASKGAPIRTADIASFFKRA